RVKVALQGAGVSGAVRQAVIMSDEERKRVVFKFAKGKLTMQAQGATTGRSKVELPVEFDSKAIDISFNPAFLIDMLRILAPDAELTLEMVDGNSPAMFKTGPAYSNLVMPLT